MKITDIFERLGIPAIGGIIACIISFFIPKLVLSIVIGGLTFFLIRKIIKS